MYVKKGKLQDKELNQITRFLKSYRSVFWKNLTSTKLESTKIEAYSVTELHANELGRRETVHDELRNTQTKGKAAFTKVVSVKETDGMEAKALLTNTEEAR